MIPAYKLKDGYKIFISHVSIKQSVNADRYSSYGVHFSIARNEDAAQSLVRENMNTPKEYIVDISSIEATSQDIMHYIACDYFPGFNDGCVLEVFKTSPFNMTDVNHLVSKGFSLTQNPSAELSTDALLQLSTEVREMWSTFGFDSSVSKSYQKDGLKLLDQVINGELDPVKISHQLYQTIALFRHTSSQAVNIGDRS